MLWTKWHQALWDETMYKYCISGTRLVCSLCIHFHAIDWPNKRKFEQFLPIQFQLWIGKQTNVIAIIWRMNDIEDDLTVFQGQNNCITIYNIYV